MAEGNRKDPRARVLNMTVRYKSATVDEFIENHSHDISKGGIFIKTRSPFPAGTLLKFEVRIAEDQKLMQGVGRVVWRREPDRAEENFPAGMGIKFIKTAEGSAELISQIVAARQGAESSFDAGVRESGVTISGHPPVSVPALSGAPGLHDSGRPTMPGPGPESERTPSLQVESGPRSFPLEAETTVSSPPKKRLDQAPDKRKVVLQGPALEGPPSSHPKAVAATVPTAPSADERAPSRAARQGIAEETTARRIRPSAAPQRSNPSAYGLVAILGVIALGVYLLNRTRAKTSEEPLPPATAVAPAPVAEPAPVRTDPQPAEPEAVEAEEAPEGEGEEAAEPAAAEATPQSPESVAAAPAAPAPSAAKAAPTTPPPAAAAAAPPPAPAPAAPAATLPKPPAAAPAKPPPAPVAAAPAPRPAPAPPARPKAPPPPSEPRAIIKPSEEPAPSTPSQPPPAAAAPSEEQPADKKKPAAAAPAQPSAPAPSPSPTPAPAAPTPPSDDNPY